MVQCHFVVKASLCPAEIVPLAANSSSESTADAAAACALPDETRFPASTCGVSWDFGFHKMLDDMLQDPDLREPLGLCAYAGDLLQRLEGRAVGAASLALWRTFAWTAQGSPKKDFVLTAEEIMASQELLTKRLLQT